MAHIPLGPWLENKSQVRFCPSDLGEFHDAQAEGIFLLGVQSLLFLEGRIKCSVSLIGHAASQFPTEKARGGGAGERPPQHEFPISNTSYERQLRVLVVPSHLMQSKLNSNFLFPK